MHAFLRATARYAAIVGWLGIRVAQQPITLHGAVAVQRRTPLTSRWCDSRNLSSALRQAVNFVLQRTANWA